MKSLPIGEVLKEYGYINEEQLQIALDAQKKDRSKRLGEHLIDLGFVSEQQMLEALSDKLAEPLVSLDNIDFDINAVKKIPEAMAQKYNVKVLGQLPLNIQVRQDLDAGKPTVVAAPDSEIAKSFLDLAEKVSTELYWQGSVIPSEILFREVK